MKKILLTSAGFQNKAIEEKFLQLIGHEPARIQALFIPTAAIDADAIKVLPKCMDDLLNAGIPAQNITVYDLHEPMTFDDMSRYDAVYFCGGDTRHLLRRINEIYFGRTLHRFIENGGVYVGVSAGSVVAAGNLPENLGLLGCTLDVHVENGTAAGSIVATDCPHIRLTNDQAILITDDGQWVIE